MTAWPTNMRGVGTGAVHLAERITALSGGRLTVHVIGSEDGAAVDTVEAVTGGHAEMSHDTALYHTGRHEAFAVFAGVPWGLTAAEHTGWMDHGGGRDLWDELTTPFNLKGFLAGNTGTQMFGWFRTELRGLEDLEGRIVRMPGLGGRVLRRLGARLLALPGRDIVPALADGRLDGAEWIGPTNDLAMGFHRVAKFYYAPGFHEPGSALQLLVDRTRYEALPPDLQAIVAEAARAANSRICADYAASNGPALRTLVQQHGVTLRILPADLVEASVAATVAVLQDLRDVDAVSRRIVDSVFAYRADVTPWTRIGEQQFLMSRGLYRL